MANLLEFDRFVLMTFSWHQYFEMEIIINKNNNINIFISKYKKLQYKF